MEGESPLGNKDIIRPFSPDGQVMVTPDMYNRYICVSHYHLGKLVGLAVWNCETFMSIGAEYRMFDDPKDAFMWGLNYYPKERNEDE